MTFAVAFAAASCSQPKELRLLYWNIANGMWDGHTDHYDRFVAYVKGHDPDICVWTEAQTIYITGTETECDTADRYLVKHWDELAARYGHKYVYVGGHRDDYPQVITARFPIENTPYRDVVREKHPGEMLSTWLDWQRIDYVYCTTPLADKVVRADIIKDDYAHPVRDPDFDFYHPSDHSPILVDFQF